MAISYRCCALFRSAGLFALVLLLIPTHVSAQRPAGPVSPVTVDVLRPLDLRGLAALQPSPWPPPSRTRRSWPRTILGGALVVSAFLVPLGREYCVLLPDFSVPRGTEQACTLQLYPSRVAAALGLAGAGLALSTVFSSVRNSATRVVVTPRRLAVSHTFDF